MRFNSVCYLQDRTRVPTSDPLKKIPHTLSYLFTQGLTFPVFFQLTCVHSDTHSKNLQANMVNTAV